jgi:flagellar biosynthesis/type III secretory pathway protein FliH
MKRTEEQKRAGAKANTPDEHAHHSDLYSPAGRRARRQLNASIRQQERAERSAQEQIELLTNKGLGHCREVERLRGSL